MCGVLGSEVSGLICFRALRHQNVACWMGLWCCSGVKDGVGINH